MTALAASVTAGDTALRFAYSVTELVALQSDVDAAQAAYDRAVGHEHGAVLDRRAARITASQATYDAAAPYLDQEGIFRVGQALRLEDELVRVLRVGDVALEVERGTNGTLAAPHAAGTALVPEHMTIEVFIDGAGSDITAGDKGQVLVAFAGTIDRVRLVADQAGAAVVDILRSAFGDPPGGGVSITAAAKPELAAAASYEDEVLEGWTRELEVDDVLVPVIEELTGIERLTLVLTVAL